MRIAGLKSSGLSGRPVARYESALMVTAPNKTIAVVEWSPPTAIPTDENAPPAHIRPDGRRSAQRTARSRRSSLAAGRTRHSAP